MNLNKTIAQGVLPLFYHADPTVCINLTKALYAAGIKAIEFTNRGQNALENFKAMVAVRNEIMPDLVLAVGTIKSVDDAKNFIAAGADVLISPIFDQEIADYTQNKLPWIPGCMTPTEIHLAEKAQCKVIKLFPGNVLGAGFVGAILPLFPNLKFVVTGGVEGEFNNLNQWFQSGVKAVGMGSKLITNEIVKDQNYNLLTERTAEILKLIEKIRA